MVQLICKSSPVASLAVLLNTVVPGLTSISYPGWASKCR